MREPLTKQAMATMDPATPNAPFRWETASGLGKWYPWCVVRTTSATMVSENHHHKLTQLMYRTLLLLMRHENE